MGGYDDKKGNNKKGSDKKDSDKKGSDKKVQGEVPANSGDASSSNDPVFAPVGSTEKSELEMLSKKFGNLSLSEQLVVAKSFESLQQDIKTRKACIKSSKQVLYAMELAKKNQSKAATVKPVSEKFKKTAVKLVIRNGGITKSLVIFKSDRYGTLREAICKLFGWKKSMKLIMLFNGHPPSEKTSSTTFLYTIGIMDEMVIDVSPLTATPQTEEVEEEVEEATDDIGHIDLVGEFDDLEGEFVDEIDYSQGDFVGEFDDLEGEKSESENSNDGENPINDKY